MQTQAQMWGNSLALRIPKSLAKAAGIEAGSQITLTVVKGKLVIERTVEREYSLDVLLAGVNKRNLHSEIDAGYPQGKENL